MTAELTNADRKAYASLATTKGRRELGMFMAQGTKCVLDTFDHFQLVRLVCTAAWLEEHPQVKLSHTVVAKPADLERITTLSSAPPVIAIYRIPDADTDSKPSLGALTLALDCVQDPGNLGTIIRVADWMGVTEIYASPDTADVWNPKVVQATMGAISRVRVHYAPLPELLSRCSEIPIFGTFLDGENIYKTALPQSAIIVMGNEGNGISPEVERCVSKRLLIPSYPADRPTSESLNVAIATAITLSEFRRNG